MSLDADAIVDRRRMRRKLTFWRVTAVVVALVAVAGAAYVLTPRNRLFPAGAYIARIKVEGLIRNNQDRVEALDRLSRSSARAVIVHIDSPGGTTAGSQQLYDSLRALQAKKPTVMVVDGMAASGAYIAALSGDHIIARDTSLVGSIGVLFQFPNFTGALKTLGIQVEIDQVVAAQGGAQRLRADQPGSARRGRGDRARLLCLVQSAGEGPPRHGREPARRHRRWPRLHRPAGRGPQAGRQPGQRKDRD